MTEQTEGKGRPTPKRSDTQKRRGGPMAPPPTSRRQAAKQLRSKQAGNRQRIRQGTAVGDEKAMLPRDAGPIRRLVRDTVDSRRSLGWMLLPVAGIVVVTGLTGNVQLQAITFGIWLATMLSVAFDMVLAGFQLRTALRSTFPNETKLRGHISYGLLRTTVVRKFRMPRPQVKRGERV